MEKRNQILLKCTVNNTLKKNKVHRGLKKKLGVVEREAEEMKRRERSGEKEAARKRHHIRNLDGACLTVLDCVQRNWPTE